MVESLDHSPTYLFLDKYAAMNPQVCPGKRPSVRLTLSAGCVSDLGIGIRPPRSERVGFRAASIRRVRAGAEDDPISDVLGPTGWYATPAEPRGMPCR